MVSNCIRKIHYFFWIGAFWFSSCQFGFHFSLCCKDWCSKLSHLPVQPGLSLYSLSYKILFYHEFSAGMLVQNASYILHYTQKFPGLLHVGDSHEYLSCSYALALSCKHAFMYWVHTKGCVNQLCDWCEDANEI